MVNEYPQGTLWQDESSKGDDGLVDFYVMKEKWEFFERSVPFEFYEDYICSSKEITRENDHLEIEDYTNQGSQGTSEKP